MPKWFVGWAVVGVIFWVTVIVVVTHFVAKYW